MNPFAAKALRQWIDSIGEDASNEVFNDALSRWEKGEEPPPSAPKKPGRISEEDLKKALHKASEALHKVAMGIDSRKIRGDRWHNLTASMQQKILETELDDDQIRKVVLDAFEEVAIALVGLPSGDTPVVSVPLE